jgi:glycosyltransferase involved in cell wall biosynthesis
LRAPAVPRERFEKFPNGPTFRDDSSWEEATFALGLLRAFRPEDFDVTVTCAFPFTNLVLRRPVFGGKRPAHVFVTQNGDWPAVAGKSEYRLFDCDGLVCINPDFEERNRNRYRTALIPNGVDLDRFRPGEQNRRHFGLDEGVQTVLMVSALIPSKNVDEGVRAVAALPDVQLVVAGDGPLRDDIRALAAMLMPGRYRQINVPPHEMPMLYNSADAFLHLSRDESFGNVYVEALASGLPIVAFDLPRTRWILGDQAFYAGSETGAIATQLSEALSDRRENAARVARAEQFGWPWIAAKYRQFFEEVLLAVKG